MKPFDLKKALAGEKVITRDGREVTELKSYSISDYNVVGILSGIITRWNEDGHHINSYYDTEPQDTDLFMYEKDKGIITKWAIVSIEGSKQHPIFASSKYSHYIFDSLDTAKLVFATMKKYGYKLVKLEWEEE